MCDDAILTAAVSRDVMRNTACRRKFTKSWVISVEFFVVTTYRNSNIARYL